ncbi:YkvI family membrane protein [Sphingosinicella terrae]|uniref:YkvI family membrane protein n=1 Tax=Sphingosinicella terrae TaxID=2172047 RepID=UPI000E0D788B|nr:hypothetical protein [Sphingosinicella terrae]
MAQLNWFSRFLGPGLAFKAAVIGGGYATGRELATFFVPHGAWGGVLGLLFATAIWSLVCALTFLYAFKTASRDYRTFFGHLLGPFWPIYEIAWFLALLLILSVYAAAAGEIGAALFAWPNLWGALLLIASIVVVTAWGNRSVERLFNWVSILLYGTYGAFLVLAFVRFSDPIAAAFSDPTIGPGWLGGGLTYAGYNIIGAIVILPVTRHLLSSRDAVIAGVVAGPLAMLPAVLFFVAMIAFAPAIADESLPSEFLLNQLNMPAFRAVFQIMIFFALLESATSGVHSINERIAQSVARRSMSLTPSLRAAVSLATLCVAVFIAGHFGLVALISEGYPWLALAFLLIYVLPLCTIGVRWLMTQHVSREARAAGKGVEDPGS